MRASEARKHLRCSYTTLHNYVKLGKIQLCSVGNKTLQYDDDSVMRLATSLYGDIEPLFKITVTKLGKTSTFILDEHIVNKVLDCINNEIKSQGLDNA